MSTLVAFDPGLRNGGLAVFIDGELKWAGLVRSDEPKARGPVAWMAMARAVAEKIEFLPDRVIVEVPQVYRNGPGDPADLIELAGVNGAVIARLDGVEHKGYLPREWKGTVKKDVMTRRIESRLSEDERARIEECPAGLKHNVWDAAGLGLYALGRL